MEEILKMTRLTQEEWDKLPHNTMVEIIMYHQEICEYMSRIQKAIDFERIKRDPLLKGFIFTDK